MADETPGIRMLVVEDDKALSEIVCEELRARGHMAVAAETVAEGLEQLKQSEFEVALVDLMLPDGSGIDILKRISDEGLATEAIVLTGYATVDTAIQAMKLGAYDYVTKPARMEELEVLVVKAAEKSRLRRENSHLRRRLEGTSPPTASSPTIRSCELMATLERVAPSDLPVLVQGESGTGKELIARAVHRLSARHIQPFVAINCGAVPETLLESELFGYERGAFTGAQQSKPGQIELAAGGVLFLDEVSEMSPSAQAKFLRVLQEREFQRLDGTRLLKANVRIIAATNKNVKSEMQEGLPRGLYYRLNGVTIKLPRCASARRTSRCSPATSSTASRRRRS
jgi:DNA-binding NtrC family response regulator